jgi:Leucine-rich repeat (LRR) protein
LIGSYAEALQRTTAVVLRQNSLANVPAGLVSLASLVDLDLSNNQLGTNANAFQGIFSRLGLRRLVLCKNNLTDQLLSCIFRADSAIPMHRTLQELDLSINRMSAIPEGVKLCTNLASLTISFCRVSSLHGLSQLRVLEHLIANDNAIEDLADVVHMTSLSTLSLANNNLSTIPPELGLLTGLRTLQLEGNPQRMIRTAILQQGTDKLLAYLRSKLPQP